MADDHSASAHRQALEQLVAQYADIDRRRAELGPLHSRLMMASIAKTIAFHMRALDAPPAAVENIERQADAVVAEVFEMRDMLDMRARIEQLQRDFDALAATDPVAAQRFVEEFAKVGKFVLAERAAPFAMPERAQ